jgi:S-(hydroxymethyl)glutathione dehydrogenase/alcohol dehydrogenase
MRAIVLWEPGVPPSLEELELDPPKAGEVQVRMAASGVCHSDVHSADGDWPFSGPVAMGHEGAGVIEALGPEVDGLEVGQLVVLSWYYPCGSCRFCELDQPFMCTGTRANDDRMQDGTTRLRASGGREVRTYGSVGTLSERQVVPARAAIPVPPETPPEVAALIGCCVTTGVGAVLNTANVPRGRSAVVIGLGGVGLSAVMGATLAGADPIVAVDRAPEKLELARRLGATATVLAGMDRDATLREIRDAAAPGTSSGADFAFECAGLRATAELTVSSIGMGGTAVLVGIPKAGERVAVDIGTLVEGSGRILGSNYGWSRPAVDFPRFAALHLEGKLPAEQLIEERTTLEGVNAALDALRRGEGARRVIVFD